MATPLQEIFKEYMILPRFNKKREIIASAMEAFTLASLGAAVLVYLLTLATYRLLFHPLSKFPGPNLAAITRYYEAYYDIVKDGQYTFKIAELHKKYGEMNVPFQSHMPTNAGGNMRPDYTY